MNAPIGWLLVVVGGVLLLVGGLTLVLPSGWGPGRLPGDIVIQRGETRIYLPITTCILLSLLLSAGMWVLRWLGKL